MSRQQLQNKFTTFPASVLAPVPNPIPRPRPRPVSDTHPNPYFQIEFFLTLFQGQDQHLKNIDNRETT